MLDDKRPRVSAEDLLDSQPAPSLPSPGLASASASLFAPVQSPDDPVAFLLLAQQLLQAAMQTNQVNSDSNENTRKMLEVSQSMLLMQQAVPSSPVASPTPSPTAAKAKIHPQILSQLQAAVKQVEKNMESSA